MERVILVEVLGRGGEVRDRVRLAGLPATIGRGYGCDVIVDDPHVDALHARLSEGEGGAYLVEDLGSVNGIRDAAGSRQPRCALAPGDTVRLGHTTLRVLTPEVAVPPALPELLRETGWRRLAASPRAALLLALAVLAIMAGESWLVQVDGDAAAEVTYVIIGVVLVLALWAGGWAAGARLARHPARFMGHVAVASVALIAMSVPAVVLSFGEAAFPDSAVLEAFGWAVVAAGSIWLLTAHLELAGLARPLRRLTWAGGVMAVLFGLGALVAKIDPDEESDISLTIAGRPLPSILVPARTAEVFLADVADLQGKVDEWAAKAAGDEHASTR